ncbi:MAG: hypothetical protein CMJ28_03460 [Phycisphaerae bacterium]|nr:hypothetical protein [Phycisphaerae bacterium]
MNSSPANLVHALSFDIEDWFHMVEIEAVEDPRRWPTLSSLVERRTDEILEICHRSQTKGTFFVLGWVAERYPAMVKRIADAGHELATHSYWHRKVYSLAPDEFLKDMRQSIDVIESASGCKVRGFRAPSFSITPGSEWAFDILHELGLEYDASLFPASRGHGGYGCSVQAHAFTNTPSGRPIPELPMSVMSLGPKRVCFSGGGYLRLFPEWLIRRGVDQLAQKGIPTVVYLHPRDFAPDCPRVPMPLQRRFKCYVGAKTTARKLEMLLDRYRWGTCAEVLQRSGLLEVA